MRGLVWIMALAIVTAGCTSSDAVQYQCPDEYGPGYEAFYMEQREAYRNQTGQELPDMDRDCVPDDVEQEFGTDPSDPESYPSLDDLQNASFNEDPTSKTVKGSAVSTGAGAGGLSAANGGEATRIDVQAGVSLLYAEIRWDDPVTDLDLALSSPAQDHNANPVMYDHTAEGGSPGMPDSPHSLTISNPQEGQWLASAFINGAGANVEYEVALTIFYGATDVPDGFSGFD